MNDKTKSSECNDCEIAKDKYHEQFADIMRRMVNDDSICDSRKAIVFDHVSHQMAISSIVYRLPFLDKAMTDELEGSTLMMISPALVDDVTLLLNQPRSKKQH